MIIGGLSAYNAVNPQSMPSYGGVKYHNDHLLISSAIINALAVFAIVVGATECRRKGQEFTRPSGSETFYQKIFTMMGLVNPLTSKPDPNKVSCMRRWGIAIMDHGLANSTFSLHVTASTLADLISALISSLASASGPLHFGAQEAGYKTIVGLGGPENVPKLMEKVKRGEHRLHGFGHRTYKGVDPRVSRALLLLKSIRLKKWNGSPPPTIGFRSEDYTPMRISMANFSTLHCKHLPRMT
jgi:citrate synthase